MTSVHSLFDRYHPFDQTVVVQHLGCSCDTPLSSFLGVEHDSWKVTAGLSRFANFLLAVKDEVNRVEVHHTNLADGEPHKLLTRVDLHDVIPCLSECVISLPDFNYLVLANYLVDLPGLRLSEQYVNKALTYSKANSIKISFGSARVEAGGSVR